MDLCVTLAVERAQAFERDMVPLDAVIAASILCWNPFKPGSEGIYLETAVDVREYLTDRQSRHVALAHEDTPWMRASTDDILAAMGRLNPLLPAQVFLESSPSPGSGAPGLAY